MFTKTDFLALLCCTVLGASSALAKEPTNLYLCKKTAIQYHDSGEYAKDIEHSINQATQFLKQKIAANQKSKKQLAMILDIDETSLSNYDNIKKLDFGGTHEDIRALEDKGIDPAIAPTLALYNFAKKNNVAVFFITGRQEPERQDTIANLTKAGYQDWDGLFLRDGAFKTVPAAVYKSATRKSIEAKGYVIVLNIGDQQSDFGGGYAEKNIKLPNPYYFVP